MEKNDIFPNEGGKKEEGINLIARLEKKLYSRTEEIKHKERTKLNPKKFGSVEDWEEGGEMSYKQKPEKPHLSGYVKFFLFSLVFFLLAAGIAGYSFLSKRTVVSPDNVTVSLFGPVSLKGGEELALQVLIENKNELPLNNIDFVINFPKGTRYPNNTGKEMSRFSKKIESIAGNEVRTETVKVILFGEENQRKDMDIAIKFRIEGVGSSYTKTKNHSVNITSSPLSVKTNILKEVIAGQEMMLGIDIKSLSPSLITNPLLEISYPKGFVFKKASPAPSSGDNVWALGDMNFGEEKRLTITGAILGENEQEKVFIVSTGIPNEKNISTIDTKFSSFSQGLIIKKPFLGVNLFLNGSAESEYLLTRGKSVFASIRWVNNLPSKIFDGKIEASLKGDMVDPKKVTPKDDGFFDAENDMISWEARTTKSLMSIESGSENSTGFTFDLLPFVRENGTVFKNPEISIEVSVKGKRLSEKNVPEEIDSFVAGKIKIGTTPRVSPLVLFRTGPFPNTGPLPFRVGQETTVTVVWRISNSVNDISGARLTSVLPGFVRWTGKVFPEGANISYNPVNGEVLWNVGVVKAGAGYEGEPNEVSFQIGINPGLSQSGGIPIFIAPGTFTGKDVFTSVPISQIIANSQTYISSEAGYSREWLVVSE